MRSFILGVRPLIKVRCCLVEAASEKGHGLVGMMLSRYVVRVALLIAVAAGSFAAGMVVMEASSRTGTQPLYFTMAVLVAAGALLLAALLSYKVVAGMMVKRMRDSKLETNTLASFPILRSYCYKRKEKGFGYRPKNRGRRVLV
jgi:hypothetical protein